jgi:hypothetical protein
MLPASSIEVIQAKNQAEVVRQNTQIFQQNQIQDDYDGMYIPNPIDKFKKKEATIPEPEKPTSMTVNCDEMQYNQESNELELKGKVLLQTSPEKIKLTADRATYDRNTNIIKLFDNVSLYKDGGIITGDYMVINLNSENILMNEPKGVFDIFKINAREGYVYSNKIEAVNGDIDLAKRLEMKLASEGFGSGYDQTMLQEATVPFEMKRKRTEPYRIETKEIIIKSGESHDRITLNDAKIYYKKFKLATANNIEIYTDKDQNYIETNLPEIGGLQDFGTYIGPGFVFEAPGNSTIKVAPSLVINDGKVGIGGIFKHRSKRNLMEAGWASSSENLIVRGKYNFTKNLRADYSRHGYMDEWFFGANRPGYMLQLVHHKSWAVPDLDAIYTQRITGGYVSDYLKDTQEEDNYGTMRLRWQGELMKQVVGIGNKEQEMFLTGFLNTQAAATIYGRGDTTAIVRFGPGVYSRVKFWGSRIYALVSGVHGESPMMFDRYRYGKVALTIDENIRVSRYLTLGYSGTISPLKDNYDKDLLTESKFYALAGPEDMKVAISYDTVRESTSFDFVFLIGTDKAKIKYDRLIIENPETLGKEDKKSQSDWELRKIKVPESL